MNIFRFVGDMSHLAAIAILLVKIWTAKSCAGISLRSQFLFALAYTARYLDLFFSFISLYLTTMKILYLTASYGICYLMFFRFKNSWDRSNDYLPLYYLIPPCALLGLLTPVEFDVLEILWTFSIYMEAVAIVPQLFMISKTGEAENITSHYLFALGAYRGLYILNWIYRFSVGDHVDPRAVVAGIVQTALYADFFYLYFTKVLKGQKLELPA
eukprot:Clim_evm64s25 gene=Clim_evmTU64s25